MTVTAPEIELLTMGEAAALLKVKPRTLQRYWRGWGRLGIRVGREIKFRRADVAAWVKSNEESGALW